MTNETTTSCQSWSTNGSVAMRAARPRSQHTITLRRSNRSTMTPPKVARKNPGTIRTAITRLNAAVASSAILLVSWRIAMKPTQSPRLEKTCASQSLKNGRVPKSRQGAGGIECSSEEGGMNGAGSGLTHASGYGEGRADQGAAGSESAGSAGGATRCAGLLAAVFLAAFFAAVFLVVFFFVAFFLVAFFFAFFLVGPFAARSRRSSTASSFVTAAGSIPRGMVAF